MKQDQFKHFLFGLQVLVQQRARPIWKLSLWINASLSTECWCLLFALNSEFEILWKWVLTASIDPVLPSLQWARPSLERLHYNAIGLLLRHPKCPNSFIHSLFKACPSYLFYILHRNNVRIIFKAKLLRYDAELNQYFRTASPFCEQMSSQLLDCSDSFKFTYFAFIIFEMFWCCDRGSLSLDWTGFWKTHTCL